MKEQLGRLAKHAGIYGAGVILNKSVGFLLIPLYTRFLTPADYGVLELLDLTIFFSGIFCMMGISSAVFRFYAAYDSKNEQKEVIATALFFVTVASLLVSVALQLLAVPLASTAFGNAAFAPYVRVVSWTLFFSNLTEVPFAYWRAQHRTVLFVVVGLVRTIVSAGMLIVAVAVLHRGVQGVVYANLIANGVLGLILLGTTLADVGFRVVQHKLREMLAYGAPLIVQSLASFVLVFSDRLFLRHFADLSEVGVYSLGYKLAGIVTLLVSGPFSMAWSWQQFEMAKQENASRSLAKVQTYQFFVSIFVGLAVSVLAKDLVRIMSVESYWPAARVVPLIALSYILSNVRSVLHTGILVQRATHYLAYVSAAAALVNLALNFLLIPPFHAMGAAVATALSYAFVLGISFVVSQRIYHVQYEYGRVGTLLGLGTVTYLASAFLQLPLLPSIAVNLGLIVMFVIASARLLQDAERAVIRKLTLSLAQGLRDKLGA